jgi:hypothetical protein
MAPPLKRLDERFTRNELDLEVWFPYYLPHWSSREESRATYAVREGELRLSIPEDQPLWCADLHEEPLRVSCIQSGSFAGPVGSSVGQMPFREGLTVREAQPDFRGYTPRYGRIEVRMRGVVSVRSMVAFWLAGIEDQPERSGEICVAEIFGKGIKGETAQVGMGVHRFRDSALEEAFTTVPLRIDLAEFHTYGVDWRPGSLTFLVDGVEVHRLDQAPDYPMQLMLGVFDFPGWGDVRDVPVPELVVSHVHGESLG